MQFRLILVALFLVIGCASPKVGEESKHYEKEFPCARSAKGVVPCLKYQIEHHKLPDTNELNPLSYCDFVKLKKNAVLNDEQANELIDFAYVNENPILFRKAKSVIATDNYSLNFLWIHAKKLAGSGHLMGSNDEQLQKHVIGPLSDWREKQPLAKINFWYDGDLVSESAIESTKMVCETRGLRILNLQFRNIREIPLITGNTNLFAEQIPIYFRVDLAKAMISDHVMRYDHVSYPVQIDSDVIGITKGQLFDQKVSHYLSQLGYIFGVALTVEENSFIMFNDNQSTNILEAHLNAVILPSISAANKLLNEGRQIPPELVFHRYPHFRILVKNKYQENNGAKWEPKFGVGKNMIFPPSQFGGGGYSAQEIDALKGALVGPNGCN